MNNENEIFEPVIERAPDSNHTSPRPASPPTNNKVASAIKGVAYLNAFCGFIAGFNFSQRTGYWGHTETNYSILLSIWLVSAISTIFLFGFAEIIVLLQRLVDNSRHSNR